MRMFAPLLIAWFAGPGFAATSIVVEVPEGQRVASAVASAPGGKHEVKGVVEGRRATFSGLRPVTGYDVTLTLADGTVVAGFDDRWYAPEVARRPAAPLTADDLRQIKEIFHGVKAFENRRNLLYLAGDHERAVVLAEMIRDVDFHSGGRGEILWRVEVWFFKNQHGGWEKVQQQGRILRRERFKTKADFEAATKTRWHPALGGIACKQDETRTVKLQSLTPPEPKVEPEEAEEHD